MRPRTRFCQGAHAAQLVAVENGEQGRDRGCSNYPNALSRRKKADDIGAGEMKDLQLHISFFKEGNKTKLDPCHQPEMAHGKFWKMENPNLAQQWETPLSFQLRTRHWKVPAWKKNPPSKQIA